MQGIRHQVSAAAVIAMAFTGAAVAETSDETIRIVDTHTINGFDVGNDKVTWPSYQLSYSMCDRLFAFGTIDDGEGFISDDPNVIIGELADSWEYNEDNTVLTVTLKEGAMFHNGDPVTAEDVAWSLARAAVTPRTKNQMKVGGMVREDQFKAIDDRTVEITLDSANRFLISDLVVPMAVIYNAGLIMEHVTEDDPWGLVWTNENGDGICSGAYKVTDFKPNESFRLTRNDDWVGGELPYFQEVVYQTVSDTSSIASLVERGRADFSLSLSLKEMIALRDRGDVKTRVAPLKWGAFFVAFDRLHEPFDDVRVRQALAKSIPGESWHESTFFGEGVRLDCGDPDSDDIAMPVAFPYCLDLDAAKAGLEEAGIPAGTSFPFAFNQSNASVFEPLAVLWKESLQKIGYDLDIQKLTGSVFSEGRNNDKLPMLADPLGAWLGGSPDYFFRIFWSGDWRDNAGNYDNPELAALLESNVATFDPDQYKAEVSQMIDWAVEDLPIFPLRLRANNYVAAKNLGGIRTPFHGRWDFRTYHRMD